MDPRPLRCALLSVLFAALSACGCPEAPPHDPSCQVQVVTYAEAVAQCPSHIDEPYWRCSPEWCDTSSPGLPPGVDAEPISAYLASFPALVEGCTWLNFSEPEVGWLANGVIPLPAGFAWLSFDRYEGACGWGKTESYANALLAAAKPGQQVGIVVEDDPTVIALARDWACRRGGAFVAVWPGPYKAF